MIELTVRKTLIFPMLNRFLESHLGARKEFELRLAALLINVLRIATPGQPVEERTKAVNRAAAEVPHPGGF